MHATKISPSNTTLAARYALAATTLGLGVLFSRQIAPEHGAALLKLFYGLTILIILRVTFLWGARRGFPLRRANGSFAFDHFSRNLVMSLLMWIGLTSITGLLFALWVGFSR